MIIRISERSLFVILIIALLMCFGFQRRKPEPLAAPTLPDLPPPPRPAKAPMATPTEPRATHNHPLPDGQAVIKDEPTAPRASRRQSHPFSWTGKPAQTAQEIIASTRAAGAKVIQEELSREPAY